ncbi:MAG TPA: O-antigen ligase family protein, partial [Bryobacteraceae bacterium]|nr:O-antigen ligase family protein [Bryobacteraceae bacterium]
MWLVAASAASLIVSACLSSNPELSWYGSAWRRYGVIAQVATLLLAWGVAAQASKVSSMLKIISAAGLITALYGIAQYFGWDPILPAASYHIGEGVWTIVRPPSTLGYSSYFATWLLFIVFLSFDLPRWPGRFIAAICVVAMLLTGTRAAMLGLIAGAAVWLFWRGVRIPRKAIAIAGAVIVAAAAFYFSPPGQMVRARARWYREDPWGGARLLLWRDSALMASAHPVFGFGPETFTANFPHYESRGLARAYPDFAHESPHNIFLDAFCAQGFPGLLLMLAWCALGFAAAWRIRGKYPTTAAGLAGALAAGIASQLFTAFTVPTAVIFFATIALADGLESGVTPPRRYIPLFAPLLYFAVRYVHLDRELALTQHAIAARDLTSAAAHYAASRNG